MVQDMRVDVANASRLFDSSLVGVVLDLVEPIELLPEDHDAVIDSGCTYVQRWANSGTTYYAPDTLNVYAGEQIAGWLAAAGLSCFGSYHRPNVIYVRVDGAHQSWVLAHEVGHALGLQGTCGHTEVADYCGFDSLNLMWDAPAGALPRRSRLTLGQAYRMNLSDSSWLNLAGLRDVSQVKACQPDCWMWNDRSTCTVSNPCMRMGQPCAGAPP